MCRRTAKGGGVFHCTYHPNRTQQYRDRRGNPVKARGGPRDCPFGNRLCEYGVRGGAGRECWNYHPLASWWRIPGSGPATWVTARMEETAPTGRGAVIRGVVHHAG
ncbi:hypothetical protein AAFF_G00128960 [Aldrovandia affinis]|uniref:Uncharacterized protein n=1 Tax=Aldrovandia affinis TaxID=143900 RepID=A0AAD7WXE2_9TELE|nr:hypothetical protein AAFF_G00128960 [Aldrovandia affinis]